MGRAAERAINAVLNMESTILMQAWMIYHKETLSIDFGQRKWTMLYGPGYWCQLVLTTLGFKLETTLFSS